MKPRRTRPYVCVDVDFADHTRFQATTDLDAAAGTWLRCLAHSRAQQQDGIVKQTWVRRAFAETLHRIDELVAVGLLLQRDDGDYEIRAYAPRNQTLAMMEEQRESARERMSVRRAALAQTRGAVTPNRRAGSARSLEVPESRANSMAWHEENKRRTNDEQQANEQRTNPNTITTHRGRTGALPIHENDGSHAEEARASVASSEPFSSLAASYRENLKDDEGLSATSDAEMPVPSPRVTPNNHRTNGEQGANERRTNAFVPTSTSIKASLSSSLVDDLSLRDLPDHVRAVPRAPVHADRLPLPASERSFSGTFWLSAFSDGIREQTGRPCTIGRVYLGTLERIVTHHAPERDAPRTTAWLKDQAKAFAAQWDGKHPAKGLTPDGLERWLNEGRQGPPVFGRLRIVQPPAEQWHEDDWSDLGAKVDE